MSVMTEEEAKKRACCSGAQRPRDNGACIASQCMAWRWAWFGQTTWQGSGDPPGGPEGWDLLWIRGGEAGWKQRGERSPGYCGLAGSPTP